MFDVHTLRQQFPALQRQINGRTPVYFDGPAGTQVPRQTIEAIVDYLSNRNANTGGVFATSVESDQVLDLAHGLMARFLNARSSDEIIFGPNMTTLTLHLSRAIGRTLRPGDEVMVTRLDHDANIRPWVLAARDAGATVRWVDIHPEDCTLDLDDLQRQLSDKTRVVAVTAASNLVGSRVDIADVTRRAHAAGAWVFCDAVHFAPHGLIDVQAWGCDFLVCSAYKFFGPHLGVLWGRHELLSRLPAYKLKPCTDELPSRWMTGTQNHECLAGLVRTLEYMAELGNTKRMWRAKIEAAFAAIQGHERVLAFRLLEGLRQRSALRIWGVADPKQLDRRVPTFAISLKEKSPGELAQLLAAEQIFSWHGNMYAVELTERLGVEASGGLLRVGCVHYNTSEEIDRLLTALDRI
jgi:cysteine desulfurase family protein (TIGR01976 family)